VSSSVHAIVVAFHGAESLDCCLGELRSSIPTTVVDNSSSSSVEAVAHRHGAAYVDAGANVGFAAGVNLALRGGLRDGPEDVLLLNPDARLSPDDVERMARFLHDPAHARVCCVAPRLVGSDGGEQRVAWPFPSPARMWMEALGAGRMLNQPDFVVGAVLLLRGEALRQVGELDERFFLYGEEADWQRRAADHGWSPAVCPDVAAVHSGAGSSEDSDRRELLFHAAQETYIRKWHGALGWWAYRLAACVGAAARALALRGDRRTQAARRAWLYARGPRRCAGPALE
jgi:GT2 family glycosyltransferase